MLSSLKKQATVKEAALAMVLMMALFYLVWSYVIGPKSKLLEQQNQQIESVEKDKKGVEKHIVELKQKVEKQRMEVDQQSDRIVRDNDDWVEKVFHAQKFRSIPDFLTAITAPGFRLGISIDSLKYNDLNKQGGYAAVKFEFEASGQFMRIIDFIKKIEELNAPVSIDILNVKAAADEETVNITLHGTFFQLEDQNG